MDGLVQLQVQIPEQLRGVIEENRSAMVQVLEQHAGASVTGLGLIGMPQMTKDDDLKCFLEAFK